MIQWDTYIQKHIIDMKKVKGKITTKIFRYGLDFTLYSEELSERWTEIKKNK